ncbi:hypothetical protein TNCV_3212631 [Trichonephila clavipes]|nr:hypothetical protein TNCV_3212631 [Trichonephila clavipes]
MLPRQSKNSIETGSWLFETGDYHSATPPVALIEIPPMSCEYGIKGLLSSIKQPKNLLSLQKRGQNTWSLSGEYNVPSGHSAHLPHFKLVEKRSSNEPTLNRHVKSALHYRTTTSRTIIRKWACFQPAQYPLERCDE